MRLLTIVFALMISLGLAACTSSRLDPNISTATKSYFAQSVKVTKSEAFVAGIGKFGGGTPDELASEVSQRVQTGLKKDVTSLMRGQSPAIVTVQLNSIELGPTTFQSPTSKMNGTIIILDAATGTLVAQVPVSADDSQRVNQLNHDPLAGAAAALILRAVLPEKNIELRHLADVFRLKVKEQLGGSGLI
jgi:hypothetical protein